MSRRRQRVALQRAEELRAAERRRRAGVEVNSFASEERHLIASHVRREDRDEPGREHVDHVRPGAGHHL